MKGSWPVGRTNRRLRLRQVLRHRDGILKLKDVTFLKAGKPSESQVPVLSQQELSPVQLSAQTAHMNSLEG